MQPARAPLPELDATRPQPVPAPEVGHGHVAALEARGQRLLARDERVGGRDRVALSTNYSVAHFERVVTETNAKLLGCDAGWTRYLDWHVGVWCGAPETLDRVGPKLCAAGSGFHAHASERTLVGGASSEGSIWAAGVGGLGVEFHADFDWSFFDEDRVSMLDYCSVSSKGRCTADSCDESQLIR